MAAVGPSDAVTIVAARSHLPLTIQPSRPLDDEALFELCRANRDLRIERSARGEIRIMSPTGGETGRRNFLLTALFGAWAMRDGSGVGFDSSTGFLLPNGAERSPVVAWIRKERWEALTPEQRAKFVPLCPDFVIELRSPSDELAALQAKMEEYLACGAELGWLIDPQAKRVWIYRAGVTAECLQSPGTLSGAPLLPGFVLDLVSIG